MVDTQTRALVYALARHVSAALRDFGMQVEDIRMQIAGPQNSQQAAVTRHHQKKLIGTMSSPPGAHKRASSTFLR